MTLQSLFGTTLPIIQAPMAGVQDHVLAAAVSNAGGLGSLPCAMLSPASMGQELTALRALTDRPFNVNFFCHVSPQPDPQREAQWRKALAPYYAEFGIDEKAIEAGPSRLPFDHAAAEVLEPFRPAVVSFHFGLPADDLLARVRAWGAKVLATATSAAEARLLEARGIDAVIAQGAEAGGHRGNFLAEPLEAALVTSALLRCLRDAVRIPVIAAGGICEASEVAALMQLGAAGVQVGSAYLLCPESKTSAVHRAALQEDGPRQTAFTNLFSGRPARGLVNRLMRELGPISALAPEFPLAAVAVAPLRAAAERAGLGDFSPLWVGEGRSSCRAIAAAEITRDLCQRVA
jgi:nitronate monooxygenase